MNQNPFAFFTPDGGGFPQLQDSLNQAQYLDTRGNLTLKEGSLPTSSISHGSHETDSNPSTPSKQRKSDRRTPKSKAEVSERMRRWRSENAEKNRLNDLRCRVYRQARIRFGKDPTPEREAWIQSEIFRRLERRRLREVMKGNGSVPAPTAITNPMSIGMGHMSGGPITRSRSTVHPFPVHMSTAQAGVSDHAMGFPASPYSMMAGNGIYGSGQVQQSQQYVHGDGMHNLGQHGYSGFAHHPHLQHQHQHQHQQAYQHHGNHFGQAHGYSHLPQHHHHQHQQHHHQLQQHQQHPHQLQQQQQQHRQSDGQLPQEFMAGASGALPSADIYGGLKFISPLYQGRLLPSTNDTAGSEPPPTSGLYHEDPQQYIAQQSGQPAMDAHVSTHNGVTAHSVPSHQPPHELATSDSAAVVVAAAAAAAAADFSGSFHLPHGSSQAMYPYYPDNVPAFEPSTSSAGQSHGQSHSSPSTPTEKTEPHQSQYTLHATDNSVYSVMSSSPQASGPTAVHPSSAFTSFNMVHPIASNTLGAQASVSHVPGAVTRDDSSAAENGNLQISTSVPVPSAMAMAGSAASGGVELDQPSAGLHDQNISSSPTLNDVANNLFSLRHIPQPACGTLSSDVRLDGSGSSQSSGLVVGATTAGASQGGQITGNGDAQQQQQQQQTDVHRLRHNMVQPSFNLGVVPDNIQFQNYT